MCLALALLEGASEGKVGAFAYMLGALYKYYETTNDCRTEECYNTALNVLAVNLNSSENIKALQTVNTFLTPSISITSFFELIIAELELEKDGTSPFKNLELKEFVDIFIRGFKNDAELSANNALVKIVDFYVAQLRDEYNIQADYAGDDPMLQEEEESDIGYSSIDDEDEEIAITEDADDDDDDFSMDDLLAKYSRK